MIESPHRGELIDLTARQKKNPEKIEVVTKSGFSQEDSRETGKRVETVQKVDWHSGHPEEASKCPGAEVPPRSHDKRSKPVAHASRCGTRAGVATNSLRGSRQKREHSGRPLGRPSDLLRAQKGPSDSAAAARRRPHSPKALVRGNSRSGH